MSQRIRLQEPSPNIPSRGRAFAYVFPCRNEDILKIGFSRDPLDRLRTLHPRYFNFFDIDRAFLLETDHVRDARQLEREMAGSVADHRAPSPVVIPRLAAGHTEWFRGAYMQVWQAAELTQSDSGYIRHAPLRLWLRQNLIQRSDRLFEWSLHMLDAIQVQRPLDATLARPLECMLVNRIDEYAAVGLGPEPLLPADVFDWYRNTRQQYGD